MALQVWINWHNHQKDILANGENIGELPSSTEVVSESYFKKFTDPIVIMLRKPKLMLFQFLLWNLVGLVILFSFSGFYGGLTYFPPINLILSVTLHFCSIPAAIFTVVISYREAKGNLKGMDSEQQVWDRWYSRQRETQEGLPFSDTNNSESYLKHVKKILISMAHKPQQYLLHLFCWVVGFILVYGITNLIALEILSDFGQFILVFTLAFISSYREMKGFHNGRNNQRQTWMDWFNQ